MNKILLILYCIILSNIDIVYVKNRRTPEEIAKLDPSRFAIYGAVAALFGPLVLLIPRQDDEYKYKYYTFYEFLKNCPTDYELTGSFYFVNSFCLLCSAVYWRETRSRD